MHKPSITAHAGALNTQANTLDSVRAGLAFVGAGNIEVDVRFRPDGTPALGHNAADAHAPDLASVFEMMRDFEGSINLDMKERTNLPGMIELLDTYGLRSRAFMTGLLREGCGQARGCGLPYWLNGRSVKAAKKLGAVGINIFYKTCSARLVKKAHALGLAVSVWTVDSPKAMRKMLRLGVDNITSRHPDQLMEIMNDAL